jgi:uncharacterized protein
MQSLFCNFYSILQSAFCKFKVGGKNKSQKQKLGIPDSFIAADNIEYPHGNSIPLWLFGFLY